MARIGIYFGTDTGRTRRIAKLIAQKLGDAAAAPLNVNRIAAADLLAHEVLILGTPTLGDGELPGLSTGLAAASWEEFLPTLADVDLSGKCVAIFGLGDQQKYPHEFVDAMILIHDAVLARGAEVIGAWPTEGYEFSHSEAVVDGAFVGLALDQINQAVLTESRVDAWLAQLAPRIGVALGAAAVA